MFALVFERSGKQARVHFRMEGFRSSPEEVAPLFKSQPDGVYFSFQLTLGNRGGYARLLLPTPMAQKAVLEAGEGAAAGEDRESEYYGARLANLGFVPADVWTELGRTTLKVADINGLEPGDVILIDRTQARIQQGRLSGSLSVRLGRGDRGSFRGEIVPSADRLQVRLTAVDLEQQV
jgi:flagellar motor switch protein FliM